MDRPFARLSQCFDGASTLEQLVRPLLELLADATGLESTFLTSVDPDARRQSVLFARNTGSLGIREGTLLPWLEFPAAALDAGHAQRRHVPGGHRDAALRTAAGAHTLVSAPVLTCDGLEFGSLCAAHSEPRTLDAESESSLVLFAQLIGERVDRERLVEKLRVANGALARSALSDVVTGLPNRQALAQEVSRMLARAQRDDRALVVAFIDVDDLRSIAARPGHDARDRLLIAIARALEGALRGGDLIARVGVDAFVVAATVPRENAEAASGVLRSRLQSAMRGPFDIGEERLVACSGATIRTVLARSGEVDADAVLARADRAKFDAGHERVSARD
ncbi:GGDEF domain-containing protein [Cognatilysobacter lacus]|uniref:GGDEF domain-containing protein n=1 Tax=Cognatilysobacter lacus TaxID=1643323 RepID=A0A5D8ZBW5_9GAMM|nr:GGDEF domain-containing protein [Lysobacter lacus]TZF91543.1 GGDEF domain-containing protein [Lysobacter lacus]